MSALDVSIRAQILNLLRDLQSQLGLSYLFIAHDLAAVAHMSHTIVVMYLGKIVEVGDAQTLSRAPKHPYTEALFSAALPSHPDERRDEIILQGEVPVRCGRRPDAGSIRVVRTRWRFAGKTNRGWSMWQGGLSLVICTMGGWTPLMGQ